MYGFTTLNASGCTVLVMPKEFKYLLHVGEIQCIMVMCRWQEHMIVVLVSCAYCKESLCWSAQLTCGLDVSTTK